MNSSLITIPEPVDPHLRRWMLFVDGENLTLRAQRLAQDKGLALEEGPFYSRDVFVWIPGLRATDAFLKLPGVSIQRYAIRSYYYTSVTGDTTRVEAVRTALWRLGFHPEVFHKSRQDDKSKGVDISLAKDLLSHSFLNNIDVAVLVAGDGDYVPLLNEVKHLGKVVYGVFFSNGLNPKLRLASDQFIDADFDEFFVAQWRRMGGAQNSTIGAKP